MWHLCHHLRKSGSGVAKAFPSGRLAHPEGQNEEENEKRLRKNNKNLSKFEEKMRKVKLLPIRDCEAGYGLEAWIDSQMYSYHSFHRYGLNDFKNFLAW